MEEKKIKRVTLLSSLPGCFSGLYVNGDSDNYTFADNTYSKRAVKMYNDFFKVEYEEPETVKVILEVDRDYHRKFCSFELEIHTALRPRGAKIVKCHDYVDPQITDKQLIEKYLTSNHISCLRDIWTKSMRGWDVRYNGAIRLPNNVCTEGFRKFCLDNNFENQLQTINLFGYISDSRSDSPLDISVEEGAGLKKFLLRVHEVINLNT